MVKVRLAGEMVDSDELNAAIEVSNRKSCENSKWVRDHWEVLVAKYNGKFVAILNGRVVDSDEDFAKLDERARDGSLIRICDETRRDYDDLP